MYKTGSFGAEITLKDGKNTIPVKVKTAKGTNTVKRTVVLTEPKPSKPAEVRHDVIYDTPRYALTDSGAPVLFSYLPDIPRLFRFISAINFLKYSGIIVCFDFQADALRPLCGDSIELQIIAFRQFKETFNL